MVYVVLGFLSLVAGALLPFPVMLLVSYLLNETQIACWAQWVISIAAGILVLPMGIAGFFVAAERGT